MNASSDDLLLKCSEKVRLINCLPLIIRFKSWDFRIRIMRVGLNVINKMKLLHHSPLHSKFNHWVYVRRHFANTAEIFVGFITLCSMNTLRVSRVRRACAFYTFFLLFITLSNSQPIFLVYKRCMRYAQLPSIFSPENWKK